MAALALLSTTSRRGITARTEQPLHRYPVPCLFQTGSTTVTCAFISTPVSLPRVPVMPPGLSGSSTAQRSVVR